MVLLLIEILIMSCTIILGLVKGGTLGSGVASVVALFIMLFIFHLPPSSPPVTAVLIIISIGIASGALQASGGMDYMISIATKIIRRFPKIITLVAPLVCFIFVFGMGTAMISLSLEPIIAETATKSKVNPKGALISSVLASNMALLCSPASSSTAFVIMLLMPFGVSLVTYLGIVLPSTLAAIVILSLILMILEKKTPFDESVLKEYKTSATVTSHSKSAKYSTFVFLGCVFCIILFGLMPDLLPQYKVEDKLVKIAASDLVQMFMYLSAAINILVFRVKSKTILATDAVRNALGAALIVLGLGWVGATVFGSPGNQVVLQTTIGQILQSNPWVIILICGFVAMIVGAQTAVAAIVFPLALSLNISPITLIIIVQCLNINFIIPAQPTLLLACELDKTGRTKPFSFIIPGFAITAFSIILSYGLTLFI
ncbi:MULTISPECIES: anaerobic C4-dicarboxylate transporter family protein [Vagococcus]|uniref:Anaerobic dicarboxylate transport n=1 Tax=Vagococcus fluvialis bH819 TaxID=1255619 RepID=A0A1X6WMX1_9ENTE|nr:MULTISPECIES: anaerobic C4-dicarboxylate transporter family protein [Vagococcus]SLM85026.1 anaerobic dicarboxylate transport [Vagococcus fluvialis bH819]HCM88558.1 C4-dicarboxylate ABC transporter [Vagococcus sp.]